MNNRNDVRGADRLNILFVGHAGIGSNALSLYKGLQNICSDSYLLDTSYFDSPPRISLRRIFNRFLPLIYGEFASYKMERNLSKILNIFEPDLVFVFKGNWISPKFLRYFTVPKAHFHPDDSTQRINRTNIFSKSEIEYDFHFTTRIENVNEIFERTRKSVFKIRFAYDPDWHYKLESIVLDNPVFKAGFIGHRRSDREKLIFEIALKYGKEFLIVGSKWKRNRKLVKLATVLPAIYGPNFSKLIALAPLQLGLLNSHNRDQHTARTFEIPASGGLMLMQDTPEHRSIFQSEENALFFNDTDELLEKIDWVLKNPKSAQLIADRGYKVIVNNSNTWEDRAKEILRCIKDSANFGKTC